MIHETMVCSIDWFDERDIDVWMAEELRTNPIFCTTLLAHLGLEDVVVPAAKTRISVMDDHGRETDVEASFTMESGKTAALLIENKIKAGFQADQMTDYVKRGELGIRDGKWDLVQVLVFAPRYRNMVAVGLPASVKTLTFEEAASWLRSQRPAERALYRASFLERASSANVVSIETVNPFIGVWWRAVYEMLEREFATFFVADRKRLPKNTYVNPKCAGMPKYLRLDLKGNQGKVELNFSNCSQQKLHEVVSSLKNSRFQVVQYPKGASIQISNLVPYQISDGIEVIETSVRSSYQTAKDLLTFWQTNRAIFDRMMVSIAAESA
jgi:hypothetical protein